MDKIQEIWRPIHGYENYLVSSITRVKSLSRKVWNRWEFIVRPEKIMIPSVDFGYERYTLTKNNKSRKFPTHRLVALAFVPNPDNKPYVNHKNGIKRDNRPENLEWCTASENVVHAFNYLQKNPGCIQIKLSHNQVQEIIAAYNSGVKQKLIAEKFNISRSNVSLIVNKNTWANPIKKPTPLTP